jgi:MFS transporter, ACS family, hexuronate transporter
MTENTKIGNYRWVICGLIFFASTINYLDRQVIGVLKGTLETKIGITELQYGYIITAFQLSYAAGMLVVGRVIDFIGTKLGYALSLVLWSISAMLHALAKSPFSFGLYRSFLGFSESGNFPAAIKTVAEWFPKKERALATGIFNSGTNIGAILAPVLVPLLALKWGWQSAFLILGGIGLIWLIFWFIFYEIPEKQRRLKQTELAYIKSDADEKEVGEEKLSWIKLLRYKQTWAFSIGKFLTDPIWWFYLYWIPGWLESVRGTGLNFKSFGLPLIVVYSSTTVGSIFGGWLSSFMIKHGIAVYKSRKYTMLLFAFLVVPIMFVQHEGVSLWGAIALISIAASAHQAWSANIFTTVSDMFPKKAVGSVIGIGGMLGAFGGAFIAVFAGYILDVYKTLGHIKTGYTILFIIAGSAYLLAWVIMNILAPKMKRVEL